MLYKTIMLELLEQQPETHRQLRTRRSLLRTVNAYARELKAKHNEWMEVLRPARPETDPSQISAEALELALQDIQDSLSSEYPPEDNEPPSLEEAIAFIRHRTPPA